MIQQAREKVKSGEPSSNKFYEWRVGQRKKSKSFCSFAVVFQAALRRNHGSRLHVSYM